MQKLAGEVTFVGTVMHPSGTAIPCPRQYFGIGRQISDREARDLDVLLSRICKHISRVSPCLRTPNGDAASFYVSYGGLDPDPGCKITEERLSKYLDDVCRAICNWVSHRRAA